MKQVVTSHPPPLLSPSLSPGSQSGDGTGHGSGVSKREGSQERGQRKRNNVLTQKKHHPPHPLPWEGNTSHATSGVGLSNKVFTSQGQLSSKGHFFWIIYFSDHSIQTIPSFVVYFLSGLRKQNVEKKRSKGEMVWVRDHFVVF